MLSAEGARESEHLRRRELGLGGCEIAASCTLFLLLTYFFDLVEVFIEPSSGLNRFFLLLAVGSGSTMLLFRSDLVLRVLRMAWPWLLIVAWLALTTRWAGYPELSRTRVLSFASVYFAALGIAVGFRSPQTVTGTLVAAFISVMFADFIWLGFDDAYTDIGIRGIHKHKNAAGLFAVLTLIVGAYAIPQFRSSGPRVAAGLLVLASLVFLVLTKSKTSLGLAAIALGLMVIYGFWLRCQSVGRHHLVMTIVAVSLVFAAGASGTKMSKLGEVLFGDPTLTNRMAIWAAVEDMIAQSPWRGHGFGSIWDVGEEWNALPAGDGYVFYNDADLINEAHNGYLDLMLNGGRIGLGLCWLVSLRALWFALVIATSQIVPMSARWAACMIHCLVAIILVHNMTESSLFFPGGHTDYFFLILLAQIERWKAEFDAHCEAMVKK
jgi:exopolysaccharide production protein ExoQ